MPSATRSSLVCRECRATQPLGPFYACQECFGPLEIGYDFPAVTRAQIEAGPKNIWRYQQLLPVPADITGSPNMEPGYTRLIKADNLARELGMKNLWVKDDSGNPTHSFKDRVVAIALCGRPRVRQHGLRLPLDRQPGQRGRCRRRPGRHEDGRVHPARPRATQGHHHRGVRRHAGRRRRATTTTSTGSRRRSPARRTAGRSSTSTSGPTTPRAPRRSATRSPSSSAGGCPQQVVIPVASGSQLTKVDKGFARAGRARAGRGRRRTRSSGRRPRAARRSPRPSRAATTWCARSSRTPSPSRWRSATRPTGPTCSTSPAAPAAPSRTSPTTRSATASSCSPAPRASSPRPPAGSPSRR